MLIQFLVLLLAFVLCYSYNDRTNNVQTNNVAHRKYIIAMMIILILQSGLRSVAVGADTFQYYTHFEKAVESSWHELWNDFLYFIRGQGGKDPGYALFQKVFATILPSYRFYLLFVASLFFYSIGNLFVRYTRSNYEVLVAIALYQCLYYSFFSITGLRQTVATSFLLLSVPYIIDRDWKKYLLFLLLAGSQHQSSLIFAVFYLLPLLRNSKTCTIGAFALFVPVWIFGGPIATSLLMGTAFDQYIGYLDQDETTGAYNFAAFILATGLLMLSKNKKISALSEANYVFVNSVSLAIFLTPLAMLCPSNMRIIQYFSIFTLIILPTICTALSQGGFAKKKIFIYAALVLSAYALYRSQPYAFFWQDMRLSDQFEGYVINDNMLKYR